MTARALAAERNSSLRGLFFVLIFANLAFFAWAMLIDRPAEPPLNSTISRLPRLKLASEAKAGATSQAQPPPAATPSPAPPPPAAAPAHPTGAVAVQPGSAAVLASAQAPASTASAATASARCITVGPFLEDARALQAASLLKGRGFAPRVRDDQGPAVTQYWVYVPGFKVPADELVALQKLQRGGIQDAQIMAGGDLGRLISVGLFSERAGAERRAAAVQELGMTATIAERRQGEIQHWVDVDLNASTQNLPTEGLLSLEEGGQRLEIKECPAARRVSVLSRRSRSR